LAIAQNNHTAAPAVVGISLIANWNLPEDKARIENLYQTAQFERAGKSHISFDQP
jgi:hypothetical protein